MKKLLLGLGLTTALILGTTYSNDISEVAPADKLTCADANDAMMTAIALHNFVTHGLSHMSTTVGTNLLGDIDMLAERLRDKAEPILKEKCKNI